MDYSNLFATVAPDDEDLDTLEGVSGIFIKAAEGLESLVPDSEEKTRMIERLRESFFWANSAVLGEV